MDPIDWTTRSLDSEIAFSRALGSVPTEHPGLVHMRHPAVPWGGDFNCAIGVRLADFASFECIVAQVERLHREQGLDRPDRYDVYPPALDEPAWSEYLAPRGYQLHTSIWFSAPTQEGALPEGVHLYTPDEAEYMAWYQSRQQAQAWYDEAQWQQARPLQAGFARVFRPYWLLRDGMRLGWVYCGWLGAYGSLFDVWIEPEHRGLGLGRMLMDGIRCEGYRQRVPHLLLRTSESRRGFYEKCGFRECLQSSTIRLRSEG